jgi:acyl carrier protein
MTDPEILATLSQILGDLLGNDSIVLKSETRRDDVPDWDSLMYMNFIVMVEMRYGIKFRVSEIESFTDVGAIVAAIRAKRPAG